MLLTVDEWLGCETGELPPREGQVVVGIDLGGSASMSAAPSTGPRPGASKSSAPSPAIPASSIADRRTAWATATSRWRTAASSTLGDRTVPVAPWLAEVMRQVEGETVACLVMDRYKEAEISEAIAKAGVRAPLVWRGLGYRDGGEDCERFRRAAFDGRSVGAVAAPALRLRRCGLRCATRRTT